MREARLRIVQATAEMAIWIVVDKPNRYFANSQPAVYNLHPQLQRHGVPGDIKGQSLERLDPIGFEAAERVGQFRAQARVQHLRNDLIDPPTVRRRRAVVVKCLQITRAADDVGVVRRDRLLEFRDVAGFVLVITVDRDQPIVLVGPRMAKCSNERLPVTMICLVED